MFIISLWNYLKGYVIIKIEGLTLEKFINLSTSNDIYLWDIERTDYTTLEAKVTTRGFKELKHIVKSVGCRLYIEDKQGFPFLLYEFKHRKMLPIGFLLSIGLLMYLTSFIWMIDIQGNENIKDEVFKKYLQSINIKQGIRKKDIDKEDLRVKIIGGIKDISYASIHIKGTKLIIDVKEKDEEIKIVEDESPCDIIADKKAVIEKVTAENGKSLVERGDIVKKGQMIITGTIQDEHMEKPLYIHAEGEVIGLTTHSKVIEEPIVKNIKEETGKIHISRELKINGKSLKFMNGEIPFKNYIEKQEEKSPFKNGLFKFPIQIIVHEYREVNLREAEQNIDAVKEANTVKAVQDIMKKLPKNAEVLKKNTSHKVDENTITTEVIIEVREEIGVKSKLRKISNLKDEENLEKQEEKTWE